MVVHISTELRVITYRKVLLRLQQASESPAELVTQNILDLIHRASDSISPYDGGGDSLNS